MNRETMEYISPEHKFRWEKTYAFMDEHDLDGMLVFGADRSDRYDAGQYLFRDRRYQHFIFPRVGEPTMVAFSAQVAAQHQITNERGLETWIQDVRTGQAADLFPKLAAEKGISKGKLGVIGIGYGSPFYPGGWVSPATWAALKDGLPDANLVDITRDFAFVMAQRSNEDIDHLAKAAASADDAITAMMEMARPGVSEIDLYAEATSVMLRQGMRITWMLFQTGSENFAFGEPTWLTRPEKARELSAVDSIRAELFPNYAEMNSHVNMTIAVGDVHEDVVHCGDVVREAYEAGRDALKPGASFLKVCEVMQEPVREAGMWHLTPQLALLNPLLIVGGPGWGLRENIPSYAERYPFAIEQERPAFDFEIEEGMTFSLQPDAWVGRRGVRIGGLAAAVGDGCRELSDVSTRLNRA